MQSCRSFFKYDFFLKNSFVRGKKDSTFPSFMSITFTLKIRACCCCTYCHCPLPPVFLVIFTSCTVSSLFVVKMGALPILLEGHFTVVAYQWTSSETEDDTFPVKLRHAVFFFFACENNPLKKILSFTPHYK